MKWRVGAFVRVRPPRQAGERPACVVRPVHRRAEHEHDSRDSRHVTILSGQVPAQAASASDAQRQPVTFAFDEVFGPEASQAQVYARVAQHVVLGALDGYNGTIFAYGQTGSGKTYTLTGGDAYHDRGIIPRAIATVFSELRRRPGLHARCFVTYVEIYNEHGYDLLDGSNHYRPIERWERLQLMEDEAGSMRLVNLREREVRSEEEALGLLFLGNLSRATSATPMNMASSRSHCVFSLTLEVRPADSDSVRTSKLHLVDLAGSERVTGTRARRRDERTRSEGRHINLSLHYLEHVILALQSRAQGQRVHVPYRNSLMTSMLKDSLGGNSRTVFIATLNAEAQFAEESLATCKFATRCASLAHEVLLNEEEDPSAVLERVQKENRRLRMQLERDALGARDRAGPLSRDEKVQCRALTTAFLADPRPSSLLRAKDMAHAEECATLLKHMVLEARRDVWQAQLRAQAAEDELRRAKGVLEHHTVPASNALALSSPPTLPPAAAATPRRSQDGEPGRGRWGAGGSGRAPRAHANGIGAPDELALTVPAVPPPARGAAPDRASTAPRPQQRVPELESAPPALAPRSASTPRQQGEGYVAAWRQRRRPPDGGPPDPGRSEVALRLFGAGRPPGAGSAEELALVESTARLTARSESPRSRRPAGASVASPRGTVAGARDRGEAGPSAKATKAQPPSRAALHFGAWITATQHAYSASSSSAAGSTRR